MVYIIKNILSNELMSSLDDSYSQYEIGEVFTDDSGEYQLINKTEIEV